MRIHARFLLDGFCEKASRSEVLRRVARLRAGVPERLARVKAVEPHWVAALLQGVDGTRRTFGRYKPLPFQETCYALV